MWISKRCLIAILDNLSVLNREVEQQEKKIADLEAQVRGQQKMLKASLAPPMNDIIGTRWNATVNGNDRAGNPTLYSGGGIDYDRLSVETLRDINNSITSIGSVIKNIFVSGKIETK